LEPLRQLPEPILVRIRSRLGEQGPGKVVWRFRSFAVAGPGGICVRRLCQASGPFRSGERYGGSQ